MNEAPPIREYYRLPPSAAWCHKIKAEDWQTLSRADPHRQDTMAVLVLDEDGKRSLPGSLVNRQGVLIGRASRAEWKGGSADFWVAGALFHPVEEMPRWAIESIAHGVRRQKGHGLPDWAVSKLTPKSREPFLPAALLVRARRAVQEALEFYAHQTQENAVAEALGLVTLRADFQYLEQQLKEATASLRPLHQEEQAILKDIAKATYVQRRVLEAQLYQVRQTLLTKQQDLARLQVEAVEVGERVKKLESEAEERIRGSFRVQGVQTFELEWRNSR
jgi:hypothetical protein